MYQRPQTIERNTDELSTHIPTHNAHARPIIRRKETITWIQASTHSVPQYDAGSAAFSSTDNLLARRPDGEPFTCEISFSADFLHKQHSFNHRFTSSHHVSYGAADMPSTRVASIAHMYGGLAYVLSMRVRNGALRRNDAIPKRTVSQLDAVDNIGRRAGLVPLVPCPLRWIRLGYVQVEHSVEFQEAYLPNQSALRPISAPIIPRSGRTTYLVLQSGRKAALHRHDTLVCVLLGIEEKQV
ncbi:hypothetical protein C8Q74DRAFT_1218710 [Fomes fomentarius]|nr:hypothetical protein C8Q74DRAFT_1218710 [Fomes fomentarius]